MAGVYLHIPFCRNACHYCDFHFTTCFSYVDDMLHVMVKEIDLRKDYLRDQTISSIYIGGGTPSILKPKQVALLMNAIYKSFKIKKNLEITLEANPEDITQKYLKELIKIGINRLSIGIQSFHNDDLRVMNRIHNSDQAKKSIMIAKEAGIKNMNIDLIYGLPGVEMKKWSENLKMSINFNVEHLSAYHLTFEQGTVFKYWRDKKRITEVDERTSIEQYKELINLMKSAGYIHYEISNFAIEGFYSIHNSGYWKLESYIGIGPSAHSYNSSSRQWNIAKNVSYMKAVNKGKRFFETEILDKRTKYHDYLMTSLRTIWGTDLKYIEKEFGEGYLFSLVKKTERFIQSGDMEKKGIKIWLTEKGFLISDFILQNLFLD